MDLPSHSGPISPLFPILFLSLIFERHAPFTKLIVDKEYDYVIVGAGSAGSVLANRLSESPCARVLLLEAGASPPLLTEIPAFSGLFETGNTSWNYFSTPQKYTGSALRNKQVSIPSGKALGGSSSINGMLYSRGNPRNYDDWAAMGAKGWSYKEVLPYFKKLEDNKDIQHLSKEYHGTGGPMTISTPLYTSEMKAPIMKSAFEQGYKFVDANGPTQYGFYDHQATLRKGRRCSTAKAYLIPSEKRPNLHIVEKAFVTKILFQGKRAVGVNFDFKGSSRFVSALKEIILSAGPVGSPKLLMLSGIGPKRELKKLNISVISDLPVGKNLQDHYGNFLAFELDPSIPSIASKATSSKNILDYTFKRKGVLSCTWGVSLLAFLGNNISSHSHSKLLPQHELMFIEADPSFAKERGISDEAYDALLKKQEKKNIVLCLSLVLNPKSRGHVSLKSTNPYDQPLIETNYYEDERDMKEVINGLKTCRKLMAGPPSEEVGAKEIELLYPGCEEAMTEEELLECATRSMTFSASHLSGTVKMGDVRDPSTVVDPTLRVKTVEGLRVVDSSIMPKIVSGHLNAPTIMLAEKASDIIKRSIPC